jgi:trans-aconitate methyltransferase
MYKYLNDLNRIKIQANICKSIDESAIDESLSKMKNNVDDLISILDFGCGDGYLTVDRFSKYKNVKILGIDTDNAAIKSTRKKEIPKNFEFRFIDITNSNSLLPRMNLITSFNVLHHILDYHAVLKILWGLLANSGVFIIRIPDDRLKSCHPQDLVFNKLIQDYSDVSKSDRYLGLKLIPQIYQLDPPPF